MGTSIYHEDPDRNMVEINVNNYSDVWTATEHIRSSAPVPTWIDPEKVVSAREAGASPWELHERSRRRVCSGDAVRSSNTLLTQEVRGQRMVFRTTLDRSRTPQDRWA